MRRRGCPFRHVPVRYHGIAPGACLYDGNQGPFRAIAGRTSNGDGQNEEFDLESLNDQELTEQVHDDLYNGLKQEVEHRPGYSSGVAVRKVLNDALVEGNAHRGVDFRDGILFVPEVLLAANAMKGGMEILRPLLAETGVEPIGKMSSAPSRVTSTTSARTWCR